MAVSDHLRIFKAGDCVGAADLNAMVEAINGASKRLETIEAVPPAAASVGVVAGLLTAAAASGSGARFSRRSILMPWRGVRGR